MASTIEPESEPADEDTVLRERPPALGAGGASAGHPVADLERLGEPDANAGVLLDGFPRTIPQAEALAEIAHISLVISIEVPDNAIVERIVGRRMDPETGDIYHVTFKPASPEIAERLVQRADDNEETVRTRLQAYHEQTAPLAEWYRSAGLYVGIDGNQSIDGVQADVAAALKQLD